MGGGGVREELDKYCFGHLLKTNYRLENYYILVALGLTCSFKFCRKLQKLESFFTKFNQFPWILFTKNNQLYLKQKLVMIDYNGFKFFYNNRL